MSANTAAIPTQLDDPEPGSTWFLSLAGIVILVALVVAASAMYFHVDARETETKVIDPAYATLENLRKGWREQLGSWQRYDWTAADGTKVKKVRMPVDRAMEVVVKEGLPASAPGATSTGGAAKP